MMKRREFFKTMASLACGVGAYCFDNPLQPRFRLAHAASNKVLIVIFQRGACDGLNTIVPYGEDDYYNYRPTIAISPPNQNNIEAAIDLDGFFGFHPALAEFESIYKDGDMAILPAVHYPEATRSHFEGQALIETAAFYPQQGLDGWLNRHLASHSHGAQLRAASFVRSYGSGFAESMRGPEIVSSFKNLTQFNLGMSTDDETALLQRLTQIYGQSPNPQRAYSQLVKDSGQVLINDLSLIGSIDVSGYTPANGASYPETLFGSQLREIAQLVKAGVGLEVASLSTSGWDHHRDQGGGNVNGAQYQKLQEFSRGISGLYADLGPLMSNVVILTMTEFGRSARENGSLGTDHGSASSWFVISKAVSGGIYLDSGWPGLATAQLREGRDLAHTIDYRDVMGEVVSLHLGNNDLATVIPEHNYSPIGFL